MTKKIDVKFYEDIRKERSEYLNKFINEMQKTEKLQRENGYLKALFNNENDTQVIKYNGKLYRVASITYCKDHIEETLDIEAIPVGEVNENESYLLHMRKEN